MVFARLGSADKDAFFALLDEYFASRPELFANGAGPGKAAAASAVQHALSTPPPTNGWRRPSDAASASPENGTSVPVGRVAAAAAALRANNFNAGGPAAEPSPSPSPSAGGAPPRPPPRRGPSSSEEPAAPPEHNKLVQSKKFGDVDVSSGKNMFSSIRGSTAAKHATPAQVAPPTPPAFARRTDFAPPPRRVPSSASTRSTESAAAPPPPALPRRQTQQESGEWAEALYEYRSDDPGDLELEEGDRVLVVERTSDEWWTGEMNGKRGLIPAAYVKLL